MKLLFRAMREDAKGYPEVGPSARMLGVRPGIDVIPGLSQELVHPGQGGLSVSPDHPMNLPFFRRPANFQGTGKDPLWSIDQAQLAPALVYRPDPAHPDHGFVEPAYPMSLAEYQQALMKTQGLWEKVDGP